VCVLTHRGSSDTVRALNAEVIVTGGSRSNASVENCIGKCRSMKFVAAGMAQHLCSTFPTHLDKLPSFD
jgi:hypothetical protein